MNRRGGGARAPPPPPPPPPIDPPLYWHTLLISGGLLDLGVNTVLLLLSGRVHVLADMIEATVSCLKLRTRALLTTSDYLLFLASFLPTDRELENDGILCILYIRGGGGGGSGQRGNNACYATVCTHTHMRARTQTHRHMHTRTHTRTHTCTHMHTCTHKHMHTHTCTHTHTYTRKEAVYPIVEAGKSAHVP